MGRRERSVDPEAGPVQRFAHELRQLRESAGRPNYRQLAGHTGYSMTTLSEAAGGEALPSLPVTLAYVDACAGDTAVWEARWHAVAEELANAGGGPVEPYLGLASFEPHHAEWFFGREELVRDLRARIERTPFLAVFGASGSGKSSLLRAGLVSSVRAGGGWTIVLLTPGRFPVETFEARLAEAGEGPPAQRVLVVVDQFEEIFTLCADEQERVAFVDRITAAADGGTRIVLGARADFFARCAQYPRLVAALRDHQVLIGQMDADSLRSVVRQPALRAGMKVEAALVEAIVAESLGEPGALPLVSHALFETWKRRSGTTMTLAGYRKAGGVHGAIAQTAERVYTSLDDDTRSFARDVFLRMTALGEGTEDTRRRVTRAELLDEQHHATDLLARLADARLITLGEDTVEVAHEALIRCWPRLTGWLAEDREQLTSHRRLTNAATDWDDHGRDEGLLYRGVRLGEWDERDTARLNRIEREFLTAGRRQAQAERNATRRRTRLLLIGLTSFAVVLALLAGSAVVQAGRAEQGQQLAFSRQLVANARAQFQLDPELGLLLSRQAFEVTRTEETEMALRQATFESRVRATLSGHDGKITGVAYSPDGQHLATSGADGKIQVWRRGSALTDPVVLWGHTGDVWSPVFSPDGRQVVAAGTDGTVTVWNWTAGARYPVVLRGHGRRVWSAAFSPDGRHVASAGDDGTVRVWPVTGVGEPVVLRGHVGRTLGVVFSHDGQKVFSGGGDGTVRGWDLATRQTTVVLRGHDDSVEALALSPDGRTIATASTDGTVRRWDLTSPTGGSVVLGSHDGTAEGVSFSRDGRRVASTGNDGTVRVWNLDHRSGPLILRGHRGTVNAAAFSPDGRQLASVSEDGTARLWDSAQLGDPEVLRGHEGAVWAAAATPDGRLVASASADGTVRIWQRGSTGEPTVLRGHDGDVLGLSFSADGRYLVSAGDDGTVRVWPVGSAHEPVVHRGHDGRVWTAAFSPDGSRLASAGDDGTVRIWAMDDRTEPVIVHPGEGPVRYVAYSPDGRHVASAGLDGTVRVLDPAHPAAATVLRGHRGLVWSVAFSPDGSRLVSGGNDGTARVWNTAGGEPVVLTGHQGIVWGAVFSADGRHVVTAGNDTTVRFWKSSETGTPLVLHGFGASVESARFVADGHFVSAHDDGTVRIWECLPCRPIDELVEQSRHQSTRELTREERDSYLDGRG